MYSQPKYWSTSYPRQKANKCQFNGVWHFSLKPFSYKEKKVNSESAYACWAGSSPDLKPWVCLGLVPDRHRGQEMQPHCQCPRVKLACLHHGGNITAICSLISPPWYCLWGRHWGARYKVGLHTGTTWMEERDRVAAAANHLIKHLLRFSST